MTDSIINVARFIIRQQPMMTTMKLQKLCFYSQAYSLVKYDEELFPEDFRAWKNGPVAYELWKKHEKLYLVSPEKLGSYVEGSLDNREKETVIYVMEKLGKLTGEELSRRTHLEDPWVNGREGLEIFQTGNAIIPKEEIRNYYKNYPDFK